MNRVLTSEVECFAVEIENRTSIYEAAASECFSFVLAINISQNTDHHSNRNPPGASIAETKGKEFNF